MNPGTEPDTGEGAADSSQGTDASLETSSETTPGTGSNTAPETGSETAPDSGNSDEPPPVIVVAPETDPV